MKKSIAKAPASSSAFLKNEGGNVTIIFGFAFVPLMLLVGATADYSRFTVARSSLQEATDAAVLSVASKMTSSTALADAKKQAQVYLNAQPKNAGATITSAAINNNGKEFCASSTSTVPMTFMQLAKVSSLSANTTSCASLAGGVDPNTTYEIAFVLDNSGSMSESAGSTTKISGLKTAANSFVNTMFSNVSSGKLQMSVTPFNAAVVAVDPTTFDRVNFAPWVDAGGNSSQHWTVFGDAGAGNSSKDGQASYISNAKADALANGFKNRFDIIAKLKSVRSSWDWNGCFEPLPYPMDVNDTVPSTSNPDTLLVPYLAPDEPSTNKYLDSYLNDDSTSCPATGDAWRELTKACKYKNPSINSWSTSPDGVCPSQPSQMLLQLTASQSALTNKINGLQAGGTTNLHEGFMWGWRTLSPNAPFAAGRAYNTANNRKIMVFMTDGFNNWQSNPGSAGGSQYEAPGYYSLNGAVNKHLPDGSNTNGNGVNYQVNYQTALAVAGPNSNTDYHDISRAAQDELTLEACTNAKAQGIEIFTIGFSVPIDPIDKEGLALLQNCATDPSHYFLSTNATELNTAFSTIGSGLGHLRLSQ
jgi:Flp pilus assembly protein TadG